MPSHRRRPQITGLLIDISGNLHVDITPTSNAVEAFQRLIRSKIPFRLCSNSSKESSLSLKNRLMSMGFDLIAANAALLDSVSSSSSPVGTTSHDDDDDKLCCATQVEEEEKPQRELVWTSLGAVARLLKEMNLTKPYLVLSPSAREEIVAKTRLQSHLTTTGDTAADYDSVVVGLDPSSLNYANLNIAFRILKGETTTTTTAVPPHNHHHPDTPFLIATHKGKYIQTESGLSLGPGPFVTALEHATGVQALVVGKPTKTFFETVINDFCTTEIADFGTGRIAVIGDDIEADLGEGALELNLWRILVKTGKYRTGDENRTGVLPPDEVFDSFASFIDDLLSGDSRR